MDIIFIHELRIQTCIGVYAWERDSQRTLWLDIELGANTRPAAASDQLHDTLDYQAVAQRITEFAATSTCQLVETLGEQIASLLMREFAVPWLRLTLHKPGALSNTRSVGILIERGQQPPQQTSHPARTLAHAMEYGGWNQR